MGWLLAGDVEIRTTQLCIQVICIGGIGISFIRVIFLFDQNYEWRMQYWIRSISTCRQDSWCIGVSFDGFHFRDFRSICFCEYVKPSAITQLICETQHILTHQHSQHRYPGGWETQVKSSVPLGCTEECDCDAGFKQRQGSCGGCDENPKIRTHLSMCFFHMSSLYKSWGSRFGPCFSLVDN